MNSYKIPLSIAAVMICISAQQALAQTPSDVTCLLASNVFTKASTDPKQRAAANGILVYYFGRVDARLSGPGLKDELQVAARGLNKNNLASTMNACGQFMAARQRAYEGIASQISRSAH